MGPADSQSFENLWCTGPPRLARSVVGDGRNQACSVRPPGRAACAWAANIKLKAVGSGLRTDSAARSLTRSHLTGEQAQARQPGVPRRPRRPGPGTQAAVAPRPGRCRGQWRWHAALSVHRARLSHTAVTVSGRGRGIKITTRIIIMLPFRVRVSRPGPN